MDESRDGKNCYFHPNELVVGVCAFCLNERLLILAAKQEQLQYQANGSYRTHSFSNRKTYIHLPKIFALSSLLNRLDIKQRKTEDHSFSGGSSSQEESFISIKFEDNGAASWEKGTTMPKLSVEQCDIMSWNQNLKKKEDEVEGVRAVVEHIETRASTLRWRKRIGNLFQLMRWKKFSKGNIVGTKLEGVKVRHGWIRTLTKRRTKE